MNSHHLRSLRPYMASRERNSVKKMFQLVNSAIKSCGWNAST